MKQKRFPFKKNTELVVLLISFAVALLFFFYSLAFATSSGATEYPDKSTITSLNTGWSCWTMDQTWADLSLPVKLEVTKGETFVMSIRLPAELPWDAALCFRSCDQAVRVTVAGKEVYSYDTAPQQVFGKSTPAAWNFVLVGAKSAGKVVEISLTSPYAYDSGLLPEVKLGSRGALLAQTTQDHILEYIVSCSLLFLGILMAVFSLYLKLMRYEFKRLLMLGIFVMIAAVYLRVESHVPQIFSLDYFAENWISYAALMLMPLAYILYAKCYAFERYKHLYTGLFWVILGCNVIRVLLQITGIMDLAETQILTLLTVILLVVVVCVEMAEKFRKDRPPHYLFNIVGVAVLVLSICAELIAHAFYLYRGLIHGGTLFSIGLMIYVLCTIFTTVIIWVTNTQRMAVLDRQLADNRLMLLSAQMQPHLLSNTLLAIQELCYTDPEKAANAIVKFSNYLRINIDFLGREELIPFEKEYQHICNFMEIEIMRFGAELQFSADIAVSDFFVPALSIQPLVENAVHHGIRKKNGGGSVRLATGRKEDKIIIRVTDDGVGFDPKAVTERSLANLRLRLANASATLTIKSQIDAGTEIVITMGGNDAIHDR